VDIAANNAEMPIFRSFVPVFHAILKVVLFKMSHVIAFVIKDTLVLIVVAKSKIVVVVNSMSPVVNVIAQMSTVVEMATQIPITGVNADATPDIQEVIVTYLIPMLSVQEFHVTMANWMNSVNVFVTVDTKEWIANVRLKTVVLVTWIRTIVCVIAQPFLVWTDFLIQIMHVDADARLDIPEQDVK
jgi:hypothetical protein